MNKITSFVIALGIGWCCFVPSVHAQAVPVGGEKKDSPFKSFDWEQVLLWSAGMKMLFLPFTAKMAR